MNRDSTQADFDSLLDARMSEGERQRLRRAHDALLRAGPLPELPASLQQPPPVAIRRLPVPPPARPGRRVLIAALAATLGLAAAGAGYFFTNRPAETMQGTAAMHATAAAPGASGVLRIGARDRAGNYAIVLRVRGLRPLAAGSYYDMYLTDKGRLVGSCGTFKTDGGTTIVRLNVPYRLGEYSGWIIRREHAHRPPSPPLLTT
jgi:Anti-sigma-K factor rskA